MMRKQKMVDFRCGFYRAAINKNRFAHIGSRPHIREAICISRLGVSRLFQSVFLQETVETRLLTAEFLVLNHSFIVAAFLQAVESE